MVLMILKHINQNQSHIPSSQLWTKGLLIDDVPRRRLGSEKWFLELQRELDRQGISLPERIDRDELCRFYAAADFEFSRLLSSIMKTIRWRQTYSILSPRRT
ncbi:hypothetical protein LguiB_029527 [Lonicera macranthoides]